MKYNSFCTRIVLESHNIFTKEHTHRFFLYSGNNFLLLLKHNIKTDVNHSFSYSYNNMIGLNLEANPTDFKKSRSTLFFVENKKLSARL